MTFFRVNKWIVQFGADHRVRQSAVPGVDFDFFRKETIPDDPHCNTEGPTDRPTAVRCGVSPSEGILFNGALSFAGGGPNSRSSQIFFVHNLADQPIGKDSEWEVPFGNVTVGLDVVRSLYKGYGETVLQQDIFKDGDEYLANFPLLDRIHACGLHVPSPPASFESQEASFTSGLTRSLSWLTGVVPMYCGWFLFTACVLLSLYKRLSGGKNRRSK